MGEGFGISMGLKNVLIFDSGHFQTGAWRQGALPPQLLRATRSSKFQPKEDFCTVLILGVPRGDGH